MKIRKAQLHQGLELPTNEPKLTSENYDLEIVKTEIGPQLKVLSKLTKQGEFFIPLSNVSYWIPEREPVAAPAKK